MHYSCKTIIPRSHVDPIMLLSCRPRENGANTNSGEDNNDSGNRNSGSNEKFNDSHVLIVLLIKKFENYLATKKWHSGTDMRT